MNGLNLIDNSAEGTKLAPTSTKRNYGIDLLKTTSMFMVVLLHCLSIGGILNGSKDGSVQYYLGWLLEIMAYCAVDCFAMTTGYLMVNKKLKCSRIIKLWLQVMFTALVLTSAMKIVFPEQVGIGKFLTALIPVSFRYHWYFSGYFVLFFLMPFINRVLTKMTKREAVVLIAILLGIFSVLDTFSRNDPFCNRSGYSWIWLGVMYIIGASIKLFDFGGGLTKKRSALIYSVGVLLTFLSFIGIKLISGWVLNNDYYATLLIEYTSPSVVISAVGLFLLFSKISVKNRTSQKVITKLSLFSFGILVIHYHEFFAKIAITDKFTKYANGNVVLMIAAVAAGAILICLASLLIEWLRQLLFKLCRVDKFSERLGNKLDLLIGADRL